MSNVEATNPKLFFSSKDQTDPRLGDLVQSGSHPKEGVVILGYPDDEGIALNGGRIGAAAGPDEIRKYLYKMTPHPRLDLKPFWDLGNFKPSLGALNLRHQKASELVQKYLSSESQVLTFGGGNDYAYADGIGFLRCEHGIRPLIINVDAHFDVRDTSKGLTSGTPFYRLLEDGAEFDFIELGIQSQCNSKKHWQYVEEKGGKIITLEEVLDSSLTLSEYVISACGDLILRPRPTFLAIDMDAFAWPYAMGTSAAWPIGLDPSQFWTLLQILLRRLSVSVMGIYEVSPPLDPQGGTAKLAAQWAHRFLHHV